MDKSTLLAKLGLVFRMSKTKRTSADDIRPCIFVGKVIVDGKPVPAGTRITAIMGNEEKGSAQVYEDGEYGPLFVEESANHHLITFRVDDRLANQSVARRKGGGTILNLTVDTDDRL